MAPIIDAVLEKFSDRFPDSETAALAVDEIFYNIQKYIVRRWLLDEGKRVDGRRLDQIRPLNAEVALLPRVHGSGLFTRGQTQVLTVCTLAAIGDKQLLDGIDEEDSKRYMHHYNFPSYSVGEAKLHAVRQTRIGHGALASSLVPVFPPKRIPLYN